MGHAVHTRDLGRNSGWRKATVRSLAQALLQRDRIHTTRARAKETQRLVERLITLGKEGSLSSRRQAIHLLSDGRVVRRLFAEVAPRFKGRSGGYTRIVRGGYRAGDAAAMAVIELVEIPLETQDKKAAPAKKEPRGTSPSPKVSEPKAVSPVEPPVPAQGPEPSTEKKKEKKPTGLIQGLRQFLKGRDRSS
jgi:large subunit ribosomal protein L17